MLHLKRRMVRAVLMIWSAIAAALTPDAVALRRVPVEKTRLSVRNRR